MSPKIPIDILLGLDLGKSHHHACALDKNGTKVFDKPLPQLKSESAALFDDPQSHGTDLVVVDQPNTIGALPIAVTHRHGCQVGH
nr:IS110 family transposase [Corynebacterium amycolatum]